jgi:hypothetical protein
MPNVTISLDEEMLKSSRKYAERQNISLNQLIRQLLARTVMKESSEWIEDCFKLMDETAIDSQGMTWDRDELYDV